MMTKEPSSEYDALVHILSAMLCKLPLTTKPGSFDRLAR